MPMCTVISCVVGRGCLLWPVPSLGRTLLAFALIHFVLKAKFTCYSRCLLTSYFVFQSPMIKRMSFLGVGSRRSWDLYRTTHLQLLQHYWLGHRLGLLWYLMVCSEMNRDHSVIFEIASKYCILDFFVDYEGYSISFKGFLHTVVDKMVMWIKFTHSSPFYFAES